MNAKAASVSTGEGRGWLTEFEYQHRSIMKVAAPVNDVTLTIKCPPCHEHRHAEILTHNPVLLSTVVSSGLNVRTGYLPSFSINMCSVHRVRIPDRIHRTAYHPDTTTAAPS